MRKQSAWWWLRRKVRLFGMGVSQHHEGPHHEDCMTVLAWQPVVADAQEAVLPGLLCALGPVQGVLRLRDADDSAAWPRIEDFPACAAPEPLSANLRENLKLTRDAEGKGMQTLPASKEKKVQHHFPGVVKLLVFMGTISRRAPQRFQRRDQKPQKGQSKSGRQNATKH